MKSLLGIFDVPMNWLWDPDEGGGPGGGGQGAAEGDGGAAPGGGGGTGKDTDVLPGDPSYFSQISPEMRPKARASLKELQKPNDLVKAYMDLSARAARSVVIPNAEKPDPAEVKALRQVLDIPEKEADYGLKFDTFKDLPGAEATAQAIAKHALGASLSKGQAQKTLDFLLGLQRQARAEAQKQADAYRDSFESRVLEAVGGDEKKKDAVVNLYKRFGVTRLGDRDLIQRLADRGVFHDHVLAVKLAQVEAKLSEEPFMDGQGAPAKPAKRGTMGGYDPEFENRYGGEGA